MKNFATFLVALSLLTHAFMGTARAEERELSAVASRWNHNGSVMGLIPEGNRRTIIYIKPRAGLGNLVRPGTVLFTGISTVDSYKGTAPLRDANDNVYKTVEDVLVLDLI